jgi:hypothetical protein
MSHDAVFAWPFYDDVRTTTSLLYDRNTLESTVCPWSYVNICQIRSTAQYSLHHIRMCIGFREAHSYIYFLVGHSSGFHSKEDMPEEHDAQLITFLTIGTVVF